MTFSSLASLIQTYYHQDWVFDYDSDEETVAAFKRENPDCVDELARDLHELLDGHDEEQVKSMILAMEPDLTPGDQTYRQWMEEIRKFL